MWKSIPGCSGYYASVTGRILSLKNETPLLLKPSLDRKGYPFVNIEKKSNRVHRLVAAAFLGLNLNDPKQCVLHLDDDPINNKLYNLRIGTQQDNMNDMWAKRRGYRPTPKISDKQVCQLRERLHNGEKGAHLAKEYGVSVSLVSSIKNNRRRILP